MVLTHLVMFRLLLGAESTPPSDSMQGYTSIPALAFARALSNSAAPPTPSEKSMYPLYRRKRRGR